MIDTYPVGLTVREIEQRAWVEGDLRTSALLAASRQGEYSDRYGVNQSLFELGKSGQLPLKLEKS